MTVRTRRASVGASTPSVFSSTNVPDGGATRERRVVGARQARKNGAVTNELSSEPTPDQQLAVPAIVEDAEVAPVETAVATESIEHPTKVMRIGSMIKQLLDEVHQAELDPPSRARMKEVYEISVRELADTLSPDLQAELARLSLPFSSDEPSEAELRVAQAQLVGWLEGLFHGIQATLFAQQMAAQSSLEQMKRNSLPVGERGPVVERAPGTGAYL
jgi:hypothetical protein